MAKRKGRPGYRKILRPLRLAAHTMKSASATIGADGLAAICRDIEKPGNSGSA